MAGFRAGSAGDSESLFTVAAHGQPFDQDLIASYAAPASGAPGVLTFRLRLLRKLPVIFAVILAVTIWPGVYFMDQLIPGEWGWIPTWWWYIPTTVLPIPWMWRKTMRKSRAASEESAREAIHKIAQELGGTVSE
jgi:hypothetical protein